ncbi:MAG: NUDIX hydrolase [Patescibacteria group bacterium]|nr:NUDIX hydrolase [Patescibacteria group bacterium]
MELQVGVKILLKNSEGKFLLVRRNPKKYPEVGPKWDLVGGRIYPGTPLLANLQREIQEEVGLKYPGQPKLVAAQDILRVPGRHVVRLTYVGEIQGEPRTDGDHDEAKWFTAEEIKKLSEAELDSYFRALLDSRVAIL